MTKPWFTNYPENVAHEVDLSLYASLLDLFQQTTAKYRQKTAYSNFGAELTFNQVDELSRDFAAFLQSELNIVKGERVALMCPNTLCFPVAMWGIIRVGGVQVNVNPMYTSRELEHQLNDAQVDTIIIFSPSTKMLADIIDNTGVKNIITVDLDDLVNKGLPCAAVDERLTNTISFVDALAQGKPLELSEPTLSQDDLLHLQYTGGTPGLSKGAMLSHGNLIANILQYEEFSKDHIDYGNEVVITAIPMYHIFALMANTLGYFYFGAKNVLVTNPRDMPGFVKELNKYDLDCEDLPKEATAKSLAPMIPQKNTLFCGNPDGEFSKYYSGDVLPLYRSFSYGNIWEHPENSVESIVFCSPSAVRFAEDSLGLDYLQSKLISLKEKK